MDAMGWNGIGVGEGGCDFDVPSNMRSADCVGPEFSEEQREENRQNALSLRLVIFVQTG